MFLTITASFEPAKTLQLLMEYGTAFQSPQTPTPTPFLSPYNHLLNLISNSPPLTKFLTPKGRQRTYNTYNKLLTNLKTILKKEKLSVVASDKGPGLILIGTSELHKIYLNYLETNATQMHPQVYIKSLATLKTSLFELRQQTPMDNTDDRVPTFYFKIKTHKPVFKTETTKFMEIYTYKLGAKELTKISRPIVNHKTSITCLCSDFLRHLLTPHIELNPYLTRDIFQTINRLSRYGRPDKIYTADIEKFYPSTPHTLALKAFQFYNPGMPQELALLASLLQFNYLTNGTHFYHLGETGIPMGLPLAPEIARMCTAYLLEFYEPPHHQVLTLYFDDVASTYPPDDLPSAPFKLVATEPNQTQDALYDTDLKRFKPYCQPYRQPVLLHPHSHHPSSKMCEKTYYGSAFRATQIGTNTTDTLHYLLTKYLPALHWLGNNSIETITNLTEISYFPVRTPKKNESPYRQPITYAYSDTRPTYNQ